MATEVTSVLDDKTTQVVEVRNRNLSKDENMLPVHFLPEGKQCYDWIDNDLSKERRDSISECYARHMSSPEHKGKTNSVNSITYSSCHINTSVTNDSDAKASSAAVGKDDLPLFLKAAEDGEVEKLKEVLTKCPTLINITDGDGYTALHRASYSGQEDALKYLLEHGANVNARTHEGWQPIHCAARWNNLQIARVLLEHKADINAATKGLQTPLHFAALSENNVQMLEMLLLDPGININIKNAAGDTPYDLAKRNGPHFKLFDLKDEGLKI